VLLEVHESASDAVHIAQLALRSVEASVLGVEQSAEPSNVQLINTRAHVVTKHVGHKLTLFVAEERVDVVSGSVYARST